MTASLTSGATADRRVAMVMGNAAYRYGPKLANPIADAEAIAAAFERLGFSMVTRNFDLDKAAQDVALKRFTVAAKSADMAVIYYAGHGMEMDGENYLLPVDVELSEVSSLGFEATRLSDVMRAVEGARKFRFVILDACRDNPFRGRIQGLDATRSIASRGLAAVEPPGNTLVAYAARHGTTAKDGAKGENSPYAAALLNRIETPNLDIRLVLGHVRDDVLEATNNQQQPFFYGTLGGEPIQLKRVASAPAPVTKSDQAELMRALEEERDWERALRANDVATYQAFAEAWPAGRFKGQAAEKIVEIRDAQEQSDWQTATKKNTAVSYEKFLEAWPDGKLAPDARATLENAHKREAQVAYEIAYAASTNTSSNYDKPGAIRAVLANYPNHASAEDARKRLREMDEMYAARFERDAQKSGAEDYVKLFPDGARIDAAREFLRGAGDDRHWIKVLNTADSLVDPSAKIAAIKAYLKDWPEARHAEQANKLLQTLGARETTVAIAGGVVGLAMLGGIGFLVISFALWALPLLWSNAPKSLVEIRQWIADIIKPEDDTAINAPTAGYPDFKPYQPRKTLEEISRELKERQGAGNIDSAPSTLGGDKARLGLDGMNKPAAPAANLTDENSKLIQETLRNWRPSRSPFEFDGAPATSPPKANPLGMESETGPLMDVTPRADPSPAPTNGAKQ